MKEFLEKIKRFMSTKAFMIGASFLGLYLLSTGVSLALFSFLGKEPSLTGSKNGLAGTRGKIEGLPKTEECPINGGMFTKVERDIWENRRPVAAVIENHLDARPLSGVSRADVVYEAVAEGGITRLLGIFYCGAAAQDFDVAVIRSARVYYINWAMEYGDKPLFLHWGGANNICNKCPGGIKPSGDINPKVDAFKLLSQIGWRNGQYGNDLDGQTNFGYPALVRIQDRRGLGRKDPDEHTPAAHMDELYKQAEKRGFTDKDEEGLPWDENFVMWRFSDDEPSSSPEATEIAFEFWSNKPEYNVKWTYDKEANVYLRINGGEPFVDFYFNKEQIKAKNVAVQFVKEEGPVDKEGHMLYTTTGTGKALIFQNGNVIEGTWKKQIGTDRTKFMDSEGAEISFVRGTIWIEAVPAGNEVSY